MQLRIHMEKFSFETAEVMYNNFYLEDRVWRLFRCNLFYITHLIHMSYVLPFLESVSIKSGHFRHLTQ